VLNGLGNALEVLSLWRAGIGRFQDLSLGEQTAPGETMSARTNVCGSTLWGDYPG